jgi:hypothetical protein
MHILMENKHRSLGQRAQTANTVNIEQGSSSSYRAVSTEKWLWAQQSAMIIVEIMFESMT